MDPLFLFNQVNYQYKPDHFALQNVSFAINKNRKTAIVGGNGAGKSTLIFHLNGLYLPQSGNVTYNGETITKTNRTGMIEHVGIVFQDPDDQIISMTVKEDIAFGPTQLGLDANEIKRRVNHYLEYMNITNLSDQNPNELSLGQKKLVAIAGVLAMETEVMIFDEPMAFLDPHEKQKIQNIMNLLVDAGKTVIIATHDMQLVAEWADDVIIMKDGSCLGTLTPAQLFANTKLLAEAKLNLPPIAELVHSLWKEDPDKMPIRVEDAKRWLNSILIR